MQENMFISSKTYKEFLLLECLSKGNSKTQRDLALDLDVSPTMVNKYLSYLENNKLIKKKYYSSKTIEYSITKLGEERKKLLYMHYLKSSMDVYKNASVECADFLKRLVAKGYKKIILYGAGEVGDIFVHTYKDANIANLEILALIDDDLNKIGTRLYDISVITIDDINSYDYDGILISSYTNKEVMKKRLIDCSIKQDKLLEYF